MKPDQRPDISLQYLLLRIESGNAHEARKGAVATSLLLH